MSNRVDPDERAHELSLLDLSCLQSLLLSPIAVKELIKHLDTTPPYHTFK